MAAELLDDLEEKIYIPHQLDKNDSYIRYKSVGFVIYIPHQLDKNIVGATITCSVIIIYIPHQLDKN